MAAAAVAPAHAARSGRIHHTGVADARTGVARGTEGGRPGDASGVAVAEAVLRAWRCHAIALELEIGQAHALRFIVGATLAVDRALDALADEIGFRLDVNRALPFRGAVLAVDLPRALGLRAGRRLVGEKDAAVGRSLLEDLRRLCGGERR